MTEYVASFRRHKTKTWAADFIVIKHLIEFCIC